jgi:hypothetical protein
VNKTPEQREQEAEARRIAKIPIQKFEDLEEIPTPDWILEMREKAKKKAEQ